jgi:hypothetical protein
MTARTAGGRRIAVIAALLLLGAGGGCAHSQGGGCAHSQGGRCAHSQMDPSTGVPGYHSDATSVQLISAVIGGKNVFIPSTVVVTAGAPQTLSIFNTTDKPHGFAIPGLDVQIVLPAGEEIQLDLPALVGGEIYRIGCHLHPPHRSATLVVVPGR